MTTKLAGLLFLLVAIMMESFALLFLKVGAGGGAGILCQPFGSLVARYSPGARRSAWLALAVATYGGEIFLYTLALHRLDVSVAFPIGGLCFVGVAILSKAFLGEAVGAIRWLGIGCILAGAVLTGMR